MTRPLTTIMLLAVVLAAVCTPVLAQAPPPKFVYVANEGDAVGFQGSVSAYTVDATTGAPTRQGGIRTPLYIRSVAMDPMGRFLYISEEGNSFNVVAGYSIDAVTGALTQVPGSPFPAGTNDVSSQAVVDPTGQFVYAVMMGQPPYTAGKVYAFAIDQTTGALTAVPGSPFATGSRPQSVAVTATAGPQPPPPIF